MRTLPIAALLVAGVLGASSAPAQQDHASHHPPEAAKSVDMAEGEVRKVDKEARKITLRHGEIKNLQMPPMTMVFQVQDAAVLDRLRTGDKVKFRAEKLAGAYTVVAIEPVK